MPREESSYPADWLRIAEKDLGRVERLLSIQDSEAAGFYLQQAVEKFLKAFLLSKGWQLARIHDLEALLNQALTYDSSLVGSTAILIDKGQSFNPPQDTVKGRATPARSSGIVVIQVHGCIEHSRSLCCT
jgi:hypothetical protein